jgi:hypothetical protein
MAPSNELQPSRVHDNLTGVMTAFLDMKGEQAQPKRKTSCPFSNPRCIIISLEEIFWLECGAGAQVGFWIFWPVTATLEILSRV